MFEEGNLAALEDDDDGHRRPPSRSGSAPLPPSPGGAVPTRRAEMGDMRSVPPGADAAVGRGSLVAIAVGVVVVIGLAAYYAGLIPGFQPPH